MFGDLELPDNPCNKKEGKTKVELVVLSSIVYGSKCSIVVGAIRLVTATSICVQRGDRGESSPMSPQSPKNVVPP